MNTPKPGWQTTEFWLTALFVAWWNRKYSSHSVDAVAVQGAVSAASIGVYALARMFTKRAAAHPLAYAPVPANVVSPAPFAANQRDDILPAAGTPISDEHHDEVFGASTAQKMAAKRAPTRRR
jgi:hypothetical protein